MFNKIKNFWNKNPSSKISKFIFFSHSVLKGLGVLLGNLTGYIPSHVIRHVLYRNLFKIKVPNDSIIYMGCRFYKPTKIFIGHNSIIGNGAFLDGRYGLCIGNNVNIAGDVKIFTMEHDIESPDFVSIGGEVLIGDWVYIGDRVTILPGVKIKKGAVIASGAVVTKNVDEYTMVGGIPAKFIRKRPKVNYKLNTSQREYFQ